MYSMLNGDHHQEGVESEVGSADFEYADESEEDNEEFDSLPHSEGRSKKSQDPAGGHGNAAASSAKIPKCTQMSTPDPTEKAVKQAKVAPPKPRKALPRIKVVVPVALT